MKPYTLEQQMARFGIPESEQGPYVTELRQMIARKLAAGMLYQSGGSWDGGLIYDSPLSFEEKAKAMLAWDWAIQRRHSWRVEVIDPLYGWRTDVRTMKRRFYIRWRRVPAWVGDKLRELGCRYRVWRDRRLANPYT